MTVEMTVERLKQIEDQINSLQQQLESIKAFREALEDTSFDSFLIEVYNS